MNQPSLIPESQEHKPVRARDLLLHPYPPMALGILLAIGLFIYAMSIPMPSRIRGDAYNYLLIAEGFTSTSNALAFYGDRTYGFPFFLFIIRKLTSPIDIFQWANNVSYVMFSFHIIACLSFYAFCLRPRFQQAGRHPIVASILTATLISYPAFVTYTSTALTDSFTVDLLMLAATLFYAGLNSTSIPSVIKIGLSGFLLGYAIMVRPTLWPALVVFTVTFILVSLFRWNRDRSAFLKMFVLIPALMVPILPAMISCKAAYGKICIQNPAATGAAVNEGIQLGLASVRVFWSAYSPPEQPTPGIRDPFLQENYADRCRVNSLPSFVTCLFSRPYAVPFFFGKKIMGLFDVPHLQPYAVDITPRWFPFLERIYAALAFCGFLTALITTVSMGMRKESTEAKWFELPWVALILIIILTHSSMLVEGRYSFPVIPFTLYSFFLTVGDSKRFQSKPFVIWSIFMLMAASLFIYQVQAWDRLFP